MTRPAQIERAIRPEAIALGLFALVVGLTGLVIIAQAVLRQLRASRIDLITLRALGLTGRQLWSISLMQVAVVAVAGAALAVVLGVLASPIMPLGAARVAEPSPGIDVDVAVLGLGLVAIVVLLLAALAWPSWRLSTESRSTGDGRAAAPRNGRLAWLSRSAAPVTASLGIREALDPGPARGTTPVRSALVGTILAITMVVGTLVFGANLVRLVTTPQLYGQTWQASIVSQFQPIPASLIRTSLHDRARRRRLDTGEFRDDRRRGFPYSRHRTLTGEWPSRRADPGERAVADASRRDRPRGLRPTLGRPACRAGPHGPRQRRAAEDAHCRTGGVPGVRPGELHVDRSGSRCGRDRRRPRGSVDAHADVHTDVDVDATLGHLRSSWFVLLLVPIRPAR